MATTNKRAQNDAHDTLVHMMHILNKFDLLSQIQHYSHVLKKLLLPHHDLDFFTNNYLSPNITLDLRLINKSNLIYSSCTRDGYVP
jgi:hypothetical protein